MSAPAARPEVFSVAPYVGGESQLPGFDAPLKLSSNEGAFGPPPGALKAMAEAAANMHRYPDGSIRRAAPRASARNSGWTRRASSAATAPTNCWSCSSSPMAGRARS